MLNTIFNIYHHPTTTLFLDDDSDFFTSIYFKIAKYVRCKFFDDPESALNMSCLPFEGLRLTLPESFHSHTPVHDALFNNHKPLDKRRFLEPSVFVVDYDMPGINGLEVCEKISNPYIKKILLTGVADEKVAVEALNEGVIDYYLHKQEDNLVERIIKVIQKQQRKYFRDIIGNYPIYYEPPHITEPVFSSYLLDVCEQHDIVEYYFMDQPMGFLLINKQGHALILLAYTDEEVEAHIDDCNTQDAPEELLAQLTTRQNIPFFHDTNHYYYDTTISDWRKYMHPVTRIEGKQPYYCSLLEYLQTKKLLKGYRDVILASY